MVCSHWIYRLNQVCQDDVCKDGDGGGVADVMWDMDGGDDTSRNDDWHALCSPLHLSTMSH